MTRFPFGLRTKVIGLSLFLLCLPWLGYQYVWEMEKYLRHGQERTLEGTTQALATALHERPKLFDGQASFLKQVEKSRDLYAYPLAGRFYSMENSMNGRNTNIGLSNTVRRTKLCVPIPTYL